MSISTWYEQFSAAKCEKMDDETSSACMNMMFAEMKNSDPVGLEEKISGEFLYQVIDKRAEFMGLSINFWTKVFIMFICQSPGDAVMYLSYLSYWQVVTPGHPEVNMSVLARLFPVGFPTREELGRLWDLQKQAEGSGNMLDSIDWQSMFKLAENE